MQIIKICAHCKKEYIRDIKPYPSVIKKYEKRLYCSPKCQLEALNKEKIGKKMNFTEEFRKELGVRVKKRIEGETEEQRKNRVGKAYKTKIEKNIYKTMKVPNRGRVGEDSLGGWLGDKAGYSAIHKWILRHWKKKGVCEICNQVKQTEWANKDHTYKRSIRSDWFELCVKCHRNYDKQNNLKNLWK